MLVESISIILVVLLITAVFIRSKKYDYILRSLILLIVPVGNTIALLFGAQLAKIITITDVNGIAIIINIISLIISGILIGTTSRDFKSNRTRISYVVLFGAFEVILVCIFIFDILVNQVDFNKFW